jgi:hypothetical protein
MAAARAAPATPLVNSQNLDLKWSLTLRVVTVAFVCFLVAAALAPYGTHRELRQANENVADLVVRHLEVQLFRIDSNTDAQARVLVFTMRGRAPYACRPFAPEPKGTSPRAALPISS